ncbi:MAG: hypothetical protein ACXW20_19955 [Burkholderiales bacterium]
MNRDLRKPQSGLPDLDPDIEAEQGERNGVLRQADLGQPGPWEVARTFLGLGIEQLVRHRDDVAVEHVETPRCWAHPAWAPAACGCGLCSFSHLSTS